MWYIVYMDIEYYKQKLQEERQILLNELSGLGNRDDKNHSWEATIEAAGTENADTNSSADRFEDFEEKSALMTPLKAKLTQVENALERISQGIYGKCRVCGNPIEEARLSANPAAETCMRHLEA